LELGHFKNGDIVKNILMMGVVMFTFFAIFGNLGSEVFLTLGLEEKPYSVIALFLIFSTPLSFFLMPLISYISRKNEYSADEFGSKMQSSEDLVNALLKLVNENKSFPLAHKYYIFFHYSHPPLIERLKELGYKIETPDVESVG
jgi:STE24 endopeptidase